METENEKETERGAGEAGEGERELRRGRTEKEENERKKDKDNLRICEKEKQRKKILRSRNISRMQIFKYRSVLAYFLTCPCEIGNTLMSRRSLEGKSKQNNCYDNTKYIMINNFGL